MGTAAFAVLFVYAFAQHTAERCPILCFSFHGSPDPTIENKGTMGAPLLLLLMVVPICAILGNGEINCKVID